MTVDATHFLDHTMRLWYLLGIFDGEGSITGTKRKTSRGWALQCNVTMGPTDAVCMMLHDMWGGSVRQVKTKEGRQSLWSWTVSESKALPFLEVARVGLVVKQRQAELAYEMAQNMKQYTNSARKGVAVSRGQSFITDADLARRTEIMLELRSLNGARSRFNP